MRCLNNTGITIIRLMIETLGHHPLSMFITRVGSMTKKITDRSPKVVLGYKKTGNTKNFPKKMFRSSTRGLKI